MEKLLKKMFYKYFLYNLKNYEFKRELHSSLGDKEYKKFLAKIAKQINKNIEEIINQIEGQLEDAARDIEYDMNLQLEEDTWKSDNTIIEEEKAYDNKEKKIVRCVEAENCNSKDCMHIKPHIYCDSCDRPCSFGKNPEKIKCIECE